MQMITRRDVLQIGAAVAAYGFGSLSRAAAQQRITQDELLAFDHYGNVTLLHMADLHAQLMPVYLREPSVNVGAGEARGQPPHLTGKAFLEHYGIPPRTADAYALASEDFRRACPQRMAGSAVSIASPPWSRRCGPSAAAIAYCFSTAATVGRGR